MNTSKQVLGADPLSFTQTSEDRGLHGDAPALRIAKAHLGKPTAGTSVGLKPAATGTFIRSTSLPFLGVSLSCLA